MSLELECSRAPRELDRAADLLDVGVASLAGGDVRRPLLRLTAGGFALSIAATRSIPAALYRSRLGTRRAAIAGLMQATSLPFIVASTAIGLELGLIDAAGAAALVGAGLLIARRTCSICASHPSQAAMCASKRSRAPAGSAPSR